MISDEVELLPFSQTKGLTEEDNLIPLGSVLFSRGLPKNTREAINLASSSSSFIEKPDC